MRDIKNKGTVHGLKLEIGKWKYEKDDPGLVFGYAGEGITVNDYNDSMAKFIWRYYFLK